MHSKFSQCSPSLLKIFHISNGILLNFHLILLIIILQYTLRNCCRFYSFYILLMIAVFLVSLGSINDIPWNILCCLCIDQCYIKVHVDKKVKTLSCNAIKVSTLLHPSGVKSIAQNPSHSMDFSWKKLRFSCLLWRPRFISWGRYLEFHCKHKAKMCPLSRWKRKLLTIITGRE